MKIYIPHHGWISSIPSSFGVSENRGPWRTWVKRPLQLTWTDVTRTEVETHSFASPSPDSLFPSCELSVEWVITTAEAREQNEEESIKGTVVRRTWLNEAECYWPWQQWARDGNHLKGKNLLRRVPCRRDLICLFLYRSLWSRNSFCFMVLLLHTSPLSPLHPPR